VDLSFLARVDRWFFVPWARVARIVSRSVSLNRGFYFSELEQVYGRPPFSLFLGPLGSFDLKTFFPFQCVCTSLLGRDPLFRRSLFCFFPVLLPAPCVFLKYPCRGIRCPCVPSTFVFSPFLPLTPLYFRSCEEIDLSKRRIRSGILFWP